MITHTPITEEPEPEFGPGEVRCPDADTAEEALLFLDAVRDYVAGRHGEAWTRACKAARQRRWRQRSYEARNAKAARGDSPEAA